MDFVDLQQEFQQLRQRFEQNMNSKNYHIDTTRSIDFIKNAEQLEILKMEEKNRIEMGFYRCELEFRNQEKELEIQRQRLQVELQCIIHYRKVMSFNRSCLQAHAGFFRLLMKGIFYPYVL